MLRHHRHVPLLVLKPAAVAADDLWSPRNAATPGDPVTPTSPTPTSTKDRRRRSLSRRRGDERGAALVEFALIAMPLFMILFGTIEFGWAFFQLNDIRHGAREGIRLVAVDSDITPSYAGIDMDTNGERLAQAACERMDQKDDVVVTITLRDLDSPANGLDVGDDVTLQTSKPLDQLTMVFDPVLRSVDLDEVVTSRLEQTPSTGITGTTWSCK